MAEKKQTEKERVQLTPEAITELEKVGVREGDVAGDKGFVLDPTGSLVRDAQAQTEADIIKQTQDTGTNEFVSSSAPVVEEEKFVTGQIKDLTSTITPPEEGVSAAQAASTEYLRLLDEQSKALEKRRAEEEARIQTQFEGAKIGLEGAQKRETGATSTALARAGGFLGVSGSATGVLLTLAQDHRNEVTALEGKRASAIQEANNAITDKQFALAQLRVKEVKDIEKTIHDRKTQFFDDTIKATQQARQQEEYYRAKIKDDLATLGELALSDEELELDPERAAAIDSFYGVQGFTQQYLETVNNAKKAQSKADALKSQKELLDLLEQIPEGQEVTFPDGTSYVGMGKAGDVYTTLETDDAGVARMVAYNKRTGAINVSNLGAIGKAKGAGDAQKALFTDNVTSALQIQLESEKMDDGSYDPDTYLRERQLIKEADPELVSEMDKKFLNPSNGFFTLEAINQLRKKGVFAPTPSL